MCSLPGIPPFTAGAGNEPLADTDVHARDDGAKKTNVTAIDKIRSVPTIMDKCLLSRERVYIATTVTQSSLDSGSLTHCQPPPKRACASVARQTLRVETGVYP